VPSFREMLNQVKHDIVEIEPGAADDVFDQALFLDVREADEYDQGALPGALHLPRGLLELQVEGRVPDKDRKIIVYCAGGTRSALAAHALGQLGYSDVASMAVGSTSGRTRDATGSPRRPSTPLSATVTNDTSFSPRSERKASNGCWSRRSSCSVPAASAHPPRSISPRQEWERSGSSTWTSWTRRTCSVRSCTISTASASARSTRRKDAHGVEP